MDPLDYPAESTMLGGTLGRTADGRYVWSDGSEWHGVFRPETIDGYDFRIRPGYVEVPRRSAEANDDLRWCLAVGTPDPARRGTLLVPLAEWDRRRNVAIGVLWPKGHESAVLDKAMELGWEWPGRAARSMDGSRGTVERTAGEHVATGGGRS